MFRAALPAVLLAAAIAGVCRAEDAKATKLTLDSGVRTVEGRLFNDPRPHQDGAPPNYYVVRPGDEGEGGDGYTYYLVFKSLRDYWSARDFENQNVMISGVPLIHDEGFDEQGTYQINSDEFLVLSIKRPAR